MNSPFLRQFTARPGADALRADPAANLEKAVGRIREAADAGAQIVCLQELFRSPYFCQREDAALFDLAEPIPGPTTERLGRVAAGDRHRSSSARCSSAARPASTTTPPSSSTPTAASLGLYRKMHIPDDPLYYEKFYFTPGDLGFRAFDTRFGRIGVLVCWDQWFPEAARLTALQGAEVLFYPTAIGWHPAREGGVRRGAARRLGDDPARRTPSPTASTWRPSTASATKAPPDGGLEFWGASFVSDPFGSLREGRTTRKKCSSSSATAGGWRTCAATGRFCATAASTPMAIYEAADRFTDSVMVPSGAPYPGRSSIGTSGQTPRGRAVPVSDPYRPHKSVRSRYRCYRGSGR